MPSTTKLLLVLSSISVLCLSCQAQDKEISDVRFTKAQYLADMESLTTKLVKLHPSPFEFTNEEDFWQVVDGKKKQIDESTTYREFIWMCSEVVANLNCGHTSLGWFNQEREALPVRMMFPVEAKFIDNRLFVSDPLINRDKIHFGKEVFSINGRDVSSIREEIYKHISSQGHNRTSKRLLLNGYITSFIPYAMGFPDSYNIVVKGELEPVELKQLSQYSPKPRINPDEECQENLCLKINREKNVAVLTIRSFAYYGETFPTFKKFIDDAFSQIRKQKTGNLIIDLRMNDGGPSYAGVHLLKYLFDTPFKYWSHTAFENEPIETFRPFETRFDGKLFVLIDGDCSSTTPHFLALVKQNNLGVLIGEETNGNHLTFGGQQWSQLPNTGIKYCVGRNKYVSAATDFPKETGILPDHNIVQTIDDYLSGKDTVMDYAVELITK